MDIRHVRGGFYKVSGTIDEAPSDERPIRFTIRFQLKEDGLLFQRATAWGSAVAAEDSWLFESWLEEHETEIAAELGVEL